MLRPEEKYHRLGQILIIGAIFSFVFFATWQAGRNWAIAVTGVPKIVSYQGRLANSAGTLLGGSDGTIFHFKFSIYDNASTSTGTRLWPSAAPGTATATVVDGVFNVNIGDTANGFPDALTYDFYTNADVFLQIEVSSTGSAFETLSPRQRIGASGFAINADTVSGKLRASSTADYTFDVINEGSGRANLQSEGQIRVGNYSSAPTTLGGGSLYYDTANNNLFVWNAASSTWVSLGGGAGGDSTLQQAYDLGNTITATSARDIAFTLSDTATDPNFTVLVATGSTGFVEFKTPTTTIAKFEGSLVTIGKNLNLSAGDLQTAGTTRLTNAGVATLATTTVNANLNIASPGVLQLGGTTRVSQAGAGTFTSVDAGSGTIQTTGTITGATVNASTSLQTAGVTRIDSAGQGTLATTTFSGNISLSTNVLQGTTARIDFNNFDVDTSGNVFANNINATGTLTVVGVSSLAGVTFSNATGTGNLQAATLVGTTSVTSPTYTSTGGLTIDSGNNTVSIAASDTTLQRVATGTFTINLQDAANTTLSVTNTATGTASLNIAEGDLQLAGVVRISNAGAGTFSSVTTSNLTATGTLSADIVNATSSLRTSGTERVSATGTGAFANLNASGALSVTGASTLGTVTFTSATGTTSLSVTGSGTSFKVTAGISDLQGALFTTATGSGNLQAGSINSTPIGGTTASTGVFSNATTTGTMQVQGTLFANTITPTAAMTVGATGQNVTLQGATTTITSASANNIVLTPGSSGEVNITAGNLDIVAGALQLNNVTRITNAGVATLATTTVTGNFQANDTTFFVDAAGDAVGIGTTSPQEELTVYSNVAPRIRIEAPADQFPGYELSEAGLRKWLIFNANDDSLNFRPTPGNDVMTILQGGNIGIGTTTPNARLHVRGSATGTVVLIAQAISSQVANIFEARDNAGTALTSISATGTIVTSAGLNVTAGVSTLQGLTFTNATGTTLSLSSNLDVSGRIEAGSSNTVLTVASGLIDADAIGLSTTGTTTATSSISGLEAASDRLSLLRGCAASEILKWSLTNTRWECAADASGGGSAGNFVSLGPTTADAVATSGVSAIFINVTGGGPLIRLQAGGTDRFVSTSTGAVTITATGTLDALTVNQQGTGNLIMVQDAGTSTFQIADGGAATLQNVTNSTSAFRVLNAAGTAIFTVDTSAGDVSIAAGESYTGAGAVTVSSGGSGVLTLQSASTTLSLDAVPGGSATGTIRISDGDVFALGSRTDNPTGIPNGSMYYNSSANKFRCFENGVWNDCVGGGAGGGAGSLQSAYSTSTHPEITLNNASSSNPGLTLRAHANSLNDNLFEIERTAGDFDIFAVATATLIFRPETDTANAFRIQNATGTNILTIDSSSGIVSIATTAASSKFDVAGVIEAGSSNIRLTTTTGEIDADAILLSTTGTSTATSSGSGLMAVDDRLSLLRGCAASEILKWSLTNTRWECAADASGGGSAGNFVSLGPTTADTVATSGVAAIFINVTGGGPLIRLQAGGTDRFVSTSTGAVTITATGTLDALTINQQGTGNLILIQDAGTSTFQIADGGAATLQNVTNSASAFRVLNAAGTAIFTVDTSAGQFTGPTGTVTGTLSADILNATSSIRIAGAVRIDSSGNVFANNVNATGTLNVVGLSTLASTTVSSILSASILNASTSIQTSGATRIDSGGVLTVNTSTLAFTTINPTFISTGTTEVVTILQRQITGASGATSTGGRLQYELENALGTATSAGAIDVIATNVGSSTFASAILFNTRTAGGALIEMARFTSALIQPAQDVDIIPATATGVSTLGTASIPWDEGYIVSLTSSNLTATGTLSADIVNATSSLRTSGTERISATGTATFAGNLNVTLVSTLATTTIGANALQGTTATIDFNNFDVTSGGNVVAAGTISAATVNATTSLQTGGVTRIDSTGAASLASGVVTGQWTVDILNATTSIRTQGTERISGTGVATFATTTVSGQISADIVNATTSLRTGGTERISSTGVGSFATTTVADLFADDIRATSTLTVGGASSLQTLTATNATTSGSFTAQGLVRLATTTFTGNVDLQTNTLQGSTAVIDFTNFDVSSTGTVTIAGNLVATGTATIAGVTYTSTAITPAGAFTVGAQGQNLTIQGAQLDLIATSTNPMRFFAGGSERMRITDAGRILINTTATTTGQLNIIGTATGSSAVAGIYEELTINPTVGGNFQFGDRKIVTVDPQAGTSTSAIGTFVRMLDNTTSTNTVRAVELQAWSGTNTAGVNTGLRSAGRTFGIQGISNGSAAGDLIPAGVYAEIQASSSHAFRAYSKDLTASTGTLAYLWHEISTFAGTGLMMNLGQGGGAFTGNFFDLQRASTTKWMVNATGTTVIGSSTAVITSAMATSTMLVVCGQTQCALPTTATTSLVWLSSPTGTAGSNSLVALGPVQGSLADYGEWVPVVGSDTDYEAGDLLAVATKEFVSFEKTATSYDPFLAGVVTKAAAFVAGGEIDTSKPRVIMTLAGRVMVKVSAENGDIAIGDLITASSKPGYGMKASQPGRVVGMALEPFVGLTEGATGQIMVFVNPHWYQPPVSEVLQGGDNDGGAMNVNGLDENSTISVKEIKTLKLTVGSADAPAGITLFDMHALPGQPHEPYCLYIWNGELNYTKGDCDENARILGIQPAVQPPSLTPTPIDSIPLTGLATTTTEAAATTTGPVTTAIATTTQPIATTTAPVTTATATTTQSIATTTDPLGTTATTTTDATTTVPVNTSADLDTATPTEPVAAVPEPAAPEPAPTEPAPTEPAPTEPSSS